MRILLLVNATASTVTSRKRTKIRRLLAKRHDVELAETSRRGHATLLARAAANDGFDVVAVFGGDGTLNEAAEGLLHTHTALAPLPGGSTNVYARTLGYPNRAVDAARVLLASLEHGASKRVGVGTANRRPFLFNTGIGFDAAVIRRVERYGRVKRYASHPLHVVAAFTAFFRHEGRAHAEIEIDTGEVLEDVRFAIVSKTDPYTFLGPIPLHVAPETGLDGALTLTAFTSLGAFTLLGGAGAAMGAHGSLAGRPDIEQRRDLRRLVLRAPEPFPYQVDGDDVGDTARLDIAFEPDALTIVTP